MIRDIAFTLIDVGASGGVQDRWDQYTNMRFIGFEPDSRGRQELIERGRETWFSIGVAGEPGVKSFHLTKTQCNSSLLKPNRELISRLAYNLEDFEVTQNVDVNCDSLDNICQKHSICPQIVKLDTQGTEYEILNGSKSLLENHLMAAEIEVEFLPLYENQKLFADVDTYMRSMGFQLMDLGNQLYVKGKQTQDFAERKGQLVSADALYFRSIESFLSNKNQWGAELKAFLPICKAYGLLGYAYEAAKALENQAVLKMIEAEKPQNAWPQVSERKYAMIRHFFEKRIKSKNANWNYGLGNP